MGNKKYTINEISFSLPTAYRDDTVNVFTGNNGLMKDTSLVITRADFDEISIESYVLNQLKHYSDNFPGYQFIQGFECTVNDLDARSVEYSWNAEQGKLHQWQIFFLANERVIVCTFSALGEISSLHRVVIDDFVDSLRGE